MAGVERAGRAAAPGALGPHLHPLADAPESGFGKARIAFGPFLVLATLELLVFGDFIRQEVWGALLGL